VAKGTACKAVDFGLRGFESLTWHYRETERQGKLTGKHEHGGETCPVELIPRSEAIARLAARFKAGDTYFITMGQGTVTPALRRTAGLAGWVLYADRGASEIVAITGDPYYAAYMSLLDFTAPGSVAVVLACPKTEAAGAHLAEALGAALTPKTDILVTATAGDGRMAYPEMLVAAVGQVNEGLGLVLRAGDTARLN
jgi:hypothetical protein